jgi:hypothetical protein
VQVRLFSTLVTYSRLLLTSDPRDCEEATFREPESEQQQTLDVDHVVTSDGETHLEAASSGKVDLQTFSDGLELPFVDEEEEEESNFLVSVDSSGDAEEGEEASQDTNLDESGCEWWKRYGNRPRVKTCAGPLTNYEHRTHGSFDLCLVHCCMGYGTAGDCSIIARPRGRKCSRCCRTEAGKETVRRYDQRRKTRD